MATQSPVIHFLIGPPGSGKTTWTNRYVSEANRKCVVLGGDCLVDEFAERNSMTYDEAWKMIPRSWVNDLLNFRLDQALQQRADVIFDRVTTTKAVRRKFLGRVPKAYKKIAIVFELPRDELDRRLEARSLETGKSVPEEVIDSIVASYEPPDYSEFDEIHYAYGSPNK